MQVNNTAEYKRTLKQVAANKFSWNHKPTITIGASGKEWRSDFSIYAPSNGNRTMLSSAIGNKHVKRNKNGTITLTTKGLEWLENN